MIKIILKKIWKWRVALTISLAIILSIGTTFVLATSQQVEVQASVLNIRKGPGLAYDVSGQVKKGQRLTIISERNEWYQVRISDNQVGWVASWLVKNTEVSATTNQVASVISGGTPIYQSNSESAKQLTSLAAGVNVSILYRENGWYEIKYGTSVAWIKQSAVKLSSQVESDAQTENNIITTNTSNATQVVVINANNTHLRTQPNANAAVVANLSANSTLTYVKTVNQWYQVKTSSGKVGYLASWVVTLKDKGTSSSTMPKVASNLAESTIVLDPGHGGNDSGALSQTNQYEKTYTLEMAKAIAARLRSAGANVILTRSSDDYVGLSQRARISNKLNADAFISLHFDSNDSANSVSGVTTYYYNKTRDGKLARSLEGQLSALPLTNRGAEYANYEVLRENTRPSVLLELGYINNQKDFSQISSTSYRQAVANSIVNGLTAYFNN
ncbi:N-acetylmuramoyl-L-alanine amidase [Lapidilactobacillus bayanensis]|uniref:N-acetylmuramoyl-L-alanine amidase n=1 Tax=Lapidilactobacillus bayanensis TaxID=2485998 RepID=UPI000F7AEE57|nr:N-acetylmuramoyl-L-alanine amidase [Lapidilactobacillus bayanensis]